jgi:GNAT superfamily N-acetyltransferase
VNEILYQLEPQLTAAEFIDVLRRSTLAERRPVDDVPRIEQMLRKADIVLTARTSAGLLVGISRAITDFSFCCYLSDLAVDQAYQGHGIGKQLIVRTQEVAGPQAKLILVAAPGARSYYPHIGMKHHDSCWQLERKS